ncbi:MAG: hypothetical protein ACHREM_29175, partial [Polyangiales bacterium]
VFVLTLLQAAIVPAGLLAFVVPGAFVLAWATIAELYVVDADLGPIDALAAAWRTMRGRTPRLVGLVATMAILPIASGAYAVLLGSTIARNWAKHAPSVEGAALLAGATLVSFASYAALRVAIATVFLRTSRPVVAGDDDSNAPVTAVAPAVRTGALPFAMRVVLGHLCVLLPFVLVYAEARLRTRPSSPPSLVPESQCATWGAHLREVDGRELQTARTACSVWSPDQSNVDAAIASDVHEFEVTCRRASHSRAPFDAAVSRCFEGATTYADMDRCGLASSRYFMPPRTDVRGQRGARSFAKWIADECDKPQHQ